MLWGELEMLESYGHCEPTVHSRKLLKIFNWTCKSYVGFTLKHHQICLGNCSLRNVRSTFEGALEAPSGLISDVSFVFHQIYTWIRLPAIIRSAFEVCFKHLQTCTWMRPSGMIRPAIEFVFQISSDLHLNMFFRYHQISCIWFLLNLNVSFKQHQIWSWARPSGILWSGPQKLLLRRFKGRSSTGRVWYCCSSAQHSSRRRRRSSWCTPYGEPAASSNSVQNLLNFDTRYAGMILLSDCFMRWL